MNDVRFRGLTLYGVPLGFSSPPPDETGYLVFLTQDDFRRARRAGIALHWLRPADKDDRAFALAVDSPNEA